MSEASESRFEALLEFLEQQRGFDFRGYKRPSLARRVDRRMQVLGIEDYQGYQDYLELHQDEFAQLFNAILINVTSFFRDAPAWEQLAQQVLPAILKGKRPHDLVRVWSAGCASGEEAYTLAMLFAEALGEEVFRARVKIYATDVDEEALGQARAGAYSAKQMEEVDPQRRERYFEHQNGRYTFRQDLRRAVVFGRNDLIQDAPISRLDLLTCRNTLMYFNAETQAKILERFHFALNGDGRGNGHLFLGRAEMLLTHGDLFAPLDIKSRIFQKVVRPAGPPLAPTPQNANGGTLDSRNRLSELAIEESPVPRIVIDTAGRLALANARARMMFSLSPRDMGRPLEDFDMFRHPADLRAIMEQAYSERRPVTLTSIERRFSGGEARFFDVMVSPVYEDGHTALGVAITFVDVTRYAALQKELTTAREEVQTSNEELQSSNEELETTNEELQSSNEELETTNEELQSTNEELETMNEELQSTNEELQTVNEELRTRSEELNHLNAFFESVLASLSAGAIVVNKNLDVLMWNHRAEDLWGLRADEVQGKSLLNLDIGLPVAELRALMRSCLSGDAPRAEVVLDAVNRRGKTIKCRVTCSPLMSPMHKSEGVILMTEEA